MTRLPSRPRYTLCPRVGTVRTFRSPSSKAEMRMRACVDCALALELSANAPGEIEAEVSTAFRAIGGV